MVAPTYFRTLAPNASVNSSIAHPPPRATPGHLHSFFARGPGIGTCKVVPGAGNCLPAGHLTLPDVSALNTCYYRLNGVEEFKGKNEDFVNIFIHKTSHQSHMRS